MCVRVCVRESVCVCVCVFVCVCLCASQKMQQLLPQTELLDSFSRCRRIFFSLNFKQIFMQTVVRKCSMFIMIVVTGYVLFIRT